jgi:hypothetical protein
MARVPALTRKRVSDRPQTWHVHYAGVRVGVIIEQSGVANTAAPWEWYCGFYPGCGPGEQRYGRATAFEAARAAFEADWNERLPTRTDADFQEWPDQRDWTAEKCRRGDQGERMPPDWRPRA